MFLKLLKYDFAENCASILLINGILLALILFINIGMDLRAGFGLVALFGIAPLGIICSIVFLSFAIIKSLYLRLFSREGYLTLSLPVGIDSILCSKILANSAWVALSVIVAGLWVAIVADFSSIQLLFNALTNTIAQYPLFSCLVVLNGLFNIISSIVLILLVIALLNIGKITRFKGFFGVLIFMIFVSIEGAIGGGFANEMFFDFRQEIGTQMINSLFFALIFCVVKTAIYYALTRYLVQNKLEI